MIINDDIIIELQCWNMEDDFAEFNNDILFVFRTAEFEKIRDGDVIEGDVDFAFYLMRVMSEYINNVCVMITGGSAEPHAGLIWEECHHLW